MWNEVGKTNPVILFDLTKHLRYIMDLTNKKTARSFQKGKKGMSPKRKSMKKKSGKRFTRKESKVDKEIKEIEKLNAKIAELASSPEDEKTTLKKFEELPISQYTKTGLWCIGSFTFLGLKEAGFVEMTEIQQASILQSLEGSYYTLFS